jgi:hypothetical protein
MDLASKPASSMASRIFSSCFKLLAGILVNILWKIVLEKLAKRVLNVKNDI